MSTLLLAPGRFECSRHPNDGVTVYVHIKAAWCGRCGDLMQRTRGLNKAERDEQSRAWEDDAPADAPADDGLMFGEEENA